MADPQFDPLVPDRSDSYARAPSLQPLSLKPSSPKRSSLRPASDDDAHFVIKRGHLGRYRFALILKDKRLSGEVRINTLGALRSDEDKAALAEVKGLAEALVASLAAQMQTPE